MFQPKSIAPILILSACFTPIFAQNIRATLSGRVADPASASVPGAAIRATNTETNQSRSAKTSGAGDYVIPQLEPGHYTLTAEAAGFQRVVIKDIVLETGQEMHVDVLLKIGAVSESVVVEASAPLVNADSAAVGGVVEHRKIVELPLNGRNYVQLAALEPNVLPPAQGSSNATRGGINVAGGSEVSNLYLKDGIDNNSASAGANHTPILDTIREFKVLTGTYAAEYGRQSGAQVIVTSRSGANDLHGSAWEFHRNSYFDARNFFGTDKPAFHRNQFGGTLGGPVKKDRTFFFMGYEGQRYGQQEATRVAVPSLAFRAGDFSSITTPIKDARNGNAPFPGNQIPKSAWSPQGAALIALYPTPNLPGNSNYGVSTAETFTSEQFMVRGDHRFSDKDSISLVYEFQDSGDTDPLKQAGLPGWGVIASSGTQHAVVGWTHVFSPALLAEVRSGLSRLRVLNLQQDYAVDVVNKLGIQGLTDAGVTAYNNGAPSLTLSGYNGIGGGTSNPQGRGENTFQYVGAVTWIRGGHTMKFGGDYLHFLYNSFNVGFGRGSFQFDGRFSGNSAADLLLGNPFRADRNLGDPYTNPVLTSSGTYFQDDWKITARLTLNFGLRYDLFMPLTERLNKVASFDPSTSTIIVAGGQEAYLAANGALLMRPRADVGSTVWNTDKNNFAPRLGLAWRPTGSTKTVIRAGFGVFYNLQMPGNGVSQLSRSSPFRQSQTAGPFSLPVLPDLANMFTAAATTTVPPGIQRDYRTQYVNQWSFGVQREVARNLVAEIVYQGSEGHKLPIPWNINQALPGPGTVAARRPYPGWGDITGGFVSSIGNSNFHSLGLRLERRFDNGLSFLASYLWSKSIDQTSGTATTDNASPAAGQNARNLRADRSVSDFDTPQRFVFSSVYSLPFGSGKKFSPGNSVARAIVSGWQLTGILTVQSGRPFTVLTGTDASNTSGNADRPNVIGDWRVADPSPDQWFNPCTLSAAGARVNCKAGQTPAWQINAAGTFGNAGRNILRGQRTANLDLGVYRDIRVVERLKLQVRGEVFNAPNHADFLLPIASISKATFGQVTGAVAQSGFGAQRQIQLGAKLTF